MYSTRKRDLISTSSLQYWKDSTKTWSAKTEFTQRGSQETSSEGHRVSKLGIGDQGGPFRMVKKETWGGTRAVLTDVTNNVDRCHVDLFAHDASVVPGDCPNVTPSSNLLMDAWGTQAIARCEPTNPTASVTTALAEILREGIPNMIGSGLLKQKTHVGRKIGDEYLNYQFGWAPIVNELKSFAKGVKDADKILRQYRKDSGKVIRRRLVLHDDYDLAIGAPQTNMRPSPSVATAYRKIPNVPSDQRVKSVRTETATKRWFSGAFTYYLDPGETAAGKLNRYAQEADRILGTTLTPETVWNLTPWSWAADWFTNLGDVVHNVTACLFDGLVMVYGYMMETKTVTVTYTLSGVDLNGAPATLSQTYKTTTKIRRPATPFGFGLTNESLSTRQLAIIAALGLTKT